jgi:hypothetical protein
MRSFDLVVYFSSQLYNVSTRFCNRREQSGACESKEQRERLTRRIEIKKNICLHLSREVKMCGDVRDNGMEQAFWTNHREQHILDWRKQMEKLKELCAKRDALQ